MNDDRIEIVIGEFEEAARGAIADGADLLIPAEGLLNTLLSHGRVEEVDGIPVQDSYAATLCFAEMMDRLKRSGGLGISPNQTLGRADSTSVEHLRRAASKALGR
jgi:allantoin racemase